MVDFGEIYAQYKIWVILFGFITAYIGYKHTRTFILKRKFGAEPPRGLPDSYPIVCRNPIEGLRAKKNGELLSFLINLMEQYYPFLTHTVNLGDKIVVTVDPENIKALLATQFNDYVMGLRHSHFKPLLGDGIFTLDGHGWKQSRALLRPNFSREKVAHTKALEVHLQNLAAHIRKHDGKPFDIQDYFFRFTVDTATEFLFGTSLFGLMDETIGKRSPIQDEYQGANDFYDSFTASQETCSTRAWFQSFYWLIYPKDFDRNNKVVHDFAQFYIKKALNATPEEIEEKSDGGYVFLYELIKETRDPKVLQDQLLNIMIAGRDTTAGLLTMVFYELSRNPDVFEKLKEAIYNDFGTAETTDLDSLTFESLKRCDYLRLVLNEVLRLYPNVPINFRCASKDTTLPRGGGKDGSKPALVQKGTLVAYIIAAVHRNEEFYGKDSNEFKPERWADKNLKPGWAYLPFNGGPRICLGQQFALTEASYAIVRLIQMFPNLVSKNDDSVYPPKITAQLTISLAEGNNVCLY